MLSNKAYEEIRGFFTREDIKLSDSLFEKAINGLIKKGLVEFRKGADGKIKYRLTSMGIEVGKHSDSNPKDRN